MAIKHLWHPDVHRKFGERLVYYQLSFVPIYNSRQIADALWHILQETGIRAYCVYETYGPYDTIFRTWLPKGVEVHAFTNYLFGGLQKYHCIKVLPFIVEEQPLYWPWFKDGERRMPAKDDVSTLEETAVRSVDNGTAVPEILNRLRDKNLLWVPEESSLVEQSKTGVKFFVMIPPPMLSLAPPQEDQTELLRSLETVVLAEAGITEPSIYVGVGFAWILVKAKALSYDHYGAIGRLIDAIMTLGVRQYRIRTFTYLTTGTQLFREDEVEGISIAVSAMSAAAGSVRDAHWYLVREESDLFEVKGSFKLDLKRLAHARDHPKILTDNLTDEVLKTIVGFLNSRGGELLIGAVERSRYDENAVKVLTEAMGKEELSIIKDRIVVGLDLEYMLGEDFDHVRTTITNLIRDRIADYAATLVSVQELAYQDRHLILIKVDPDSESHYLDNEKFFVRMQGSTVQLDGKDREKYIERRKGNATRSSGETDARR